MNYGKHGYKLIYSLQ